MFNAALNYYASWADGVRTGAPTLAQAIRAERERYLEPLRPGGVVSNGPWVDPWGGTSQSLRGVNLLGLSTLANVQSQNGGRFVLPDLQPAPALVENLPGPIANALRLGIGSVEFSWDAFFTGGVAPQRRGELVIDFYPLYRGPNGRLYGLDRITTTLEGAINCAGVGDAFDAERTVQLPGRIRTPTTAPPWPRRSMTWRVSAPRPPHRSARSTTPRRSWRTSSRRCGPASTTTC